MKRTCLLLSILTVVIFHSATCLAQKQDMIAVYRWYIPYDDQYVTVTEDRFTPQQIKEWGWADKTLLFYGYRERKPHTVAVYSWYHSRRKRHINVCEDEYSDRYMQKRGYHHKRFQYYALTGPAENTVSVYRTRVVDGRHSWITLVDDHSTDYMIDDANKGIQYYGIAAGSK